MRRLLRNLSIACVLLTACGTADKPVREFTIIYSGNIGGKIEPCGCHPPLGGFARRSTLVNALRNQYDNPLVFDSGAVLYDNNFLTPPLDYLQRLEADVSVKSMALIGTHAINVSSFDLSNSVDSLMIIDQNMDTSWISANLVWRDNGELIFAPDSSFVSNGVKVGVFGVMSDTFRGSPLFDNNSRLEVIDYREAAHREVEKLSKSNDVVIALAYLSKSEMERMANEVEGIDIIIHSHNAFQNPSSDHGLFEPYQVDNTLILRCPDGGRVLGIVELAMVGQSTEFNKRETIVFADPEESHLDMLRNQGSSYQNTFIDLGAEIRSDPAIQTLIDEFIPIREAYKTEQYLRED